MPAPRFICDCPVPSDVGRRTSMAGYSRDGEKYFGDHDGFPSNILEDLKKFHGRQTQKGSFHFNMYVKVDRGN